MTCFVYQYIVYAVDSQENYKNNEFLISRNLFKALYLNINNSFEEIIKLWLILYNFWPIVKIYLLIFRK